jgi:hypothetical protein
MAAVQKIALQMQAAPIGVAGRGGALMNFDESTERRRGTTDLNLTSIKYIMIDTYLNM